MAVQTNEDSDDYLETVERSLSNDDNEQLAFTARRTGTYYIQIFGEDDDTTSASYTLVANRITPDETDRFEPTYNRETAAEISEGRYDATLLQGDEDWYKINLTTGDIFDVETQFSHSAGDLEMAVLTNEDSDDYLETVERSLSNDDNEQLAFTAQRTGTYYIQIFGEDDDTTSAPYRLNVNLTREQPVVDIDAQSQATSGRRVEVDVSVTNRKDSQLSGATVDFSSIGESWRVQNQSSEGGRWSPDLAWSWSSIPSGETKSATLVLERQFETREPPRFLQATVSGREQLDVELVPLWITGPSEQSPPVADAGANETVRGGVNVTLDASQSTDPNEDSLSYEWRQTNGPSVNLQNATSATPSFVAPEVSDRRTIRFRLVVRDGNGGESTDTVSVSIRPDENNSTPTGDGSLTIQRVPDSITVGQEFEIDVTTEITTPATLCPTYSLTVSEVNPNAIIGSSTQLARQEFTLRVDQVGQPVDRTISATIESDQLDGDGEAELEVKLDDVCANPIITPDSATREGIQVTDPMPQPVPGTNGDGPPTDPDGDDEYEDVNGDGQFNFVDAISFVFSLENADSYSEEQREGLDFDSSGEVDFVDVIELVFELQ
jgi:hypothetical protein